MSTCSNDENDEHEMRLEKVFKWIDDLEKVPEVQKRFSKLIYQVWELSQKSNDFQNHFFSFFYGLEERIELGKSIEHRSKHFQHLLVSYNEFLQKVMKHNIEVIEFLDQKITEEELPYDLQTVIVPEIIEFLKEKIYSLKFCRFIRNLIGDMERILTDSVLRKDFPTKHGDTTPLEEYTWFLIKNTPKTCLKCGY
ncbi:unnamed protein product [Caenorhabditis angaria]|uniref:Uncharacterized protein n=1 Tax=Caenorhabditis angaria TaxID=860376 RepID=A0A9P1J082_9PELO|nr:unnamed protein product [Caenorhabditis angaria]